MGQSSTSCRTGRARLTYEEAARQARNWNRRWPGMAKEPYKCRRCRGCHVGPIRQKALA